MDQISRHNNSHEKRDIEMGFAVTCSPTYENFIHITENLSVAYCSQPCKYLVGPHFLAMFVKIFLKWLPLHVDKFSTADYVNLGFSLCKRCFFVSTHKKIQLLESWTLWGLRLWWQSLLWLKAYNACTWNTWKRKCACVFKQIYELKTQPQISFLYLSSDKRYYVSSKCPLYSITLYK